MPRDFDLLTTTASVELKATQIRAARGYLGWTQEYLAEISGVSLTTIRSLEAGFRSRSTTCSKLRETFEQSGIEFTDDCGIRPRQDDIKLLKGSAGMALFLADLERTTAGIQTEICILFHSKGGIYPSDLLAGYLSQVRAHAPQLHLKCLTERAIETHLFNEPINQRILPQTDLSPVSFCLYANKVALLLTREANDINLVILKDIAYAQALRANFIHLWERSALPQPPGEAPPVSAPSLEPSSLR